MNAPKADISHAQNVVSGLTRVQNLANQCVNAGGRLGARAHGGERGGGVPIQSPGVAKRLIGAFQTPGQLRFHGAELHGVAARLKHRQDAGLGPQLTAQAIDGRANGRGWWAKSS